MQDAHYAEQQHRNSSRPEHSSTNRINLRTLAGPSNSQAIRMGREQRAIKQAGTKVFAADEAKAWVHQKEVTEVHNAAI